MVLHFRKWRFYMRVTFLLLLSSGIIHAQDSSGCETGFRLIVHTMGEACVPENPQRVVALEWTHDKW